MPTPEPDLPFPLVSSSPKGSSKTERGLSPPKVQNGTWTVDHPQRGHFTLKLYTVQQPGPFRGRRIIALLNGPDNERDYLGVAFWDDDALRVNVWKRHRSDGRFAPIDGYNFGRHWNVIEKKLAVWADLAIRGAEESRHGHWYTDGYRLLHEGVCVVCNRKLTNPESIRTGIGPTCRGCS